jgi:hypothetical protein
MPLTNGKLDRHEVICKNRQHEHSMLGPYKRILYSFIAANVLFFYAVWVYSKPLQKSIHYQQV